MENVEKGSLGWGLYGPQTQFYPQLEVFNQVLIFNTCTKIILMCSQVKV